MEKWWYKVSSEGYANHYCSNYYLAYSVLKNLEKRYHTIGKIEQYKDEDIIIVKNGKFGNDKVFNLNLDTYGYGARFETCILDQLQVKYIPIHAKYWLDCISNVYQEESVHKKYDNFYKIHTNLGTLCLTSNQILDLMNELRK